MGGKTYGLLCSLLTPGKTGSKTFKELVTIVPEHLASMPLFTAERFRFYKRNHFESESISAFAKELWKLSEQCNFKDGLNVPLRDRFV